MAAGDGGAQGRGAAARALEPPPAARGVVGGARERPVRGAGRDQGPQPDRLGGLQLLGAGQRQRGGPDAVRDAGDAGAPARPLLDGEIRLASSRTEPAVASPDATNVHLASFFGERPLATITRAQPGALTRKTASTTRGSNWAPAFATSSSSRRFDGHGDAVGPGGRHRVEGVAAGDDPRLQRDVLAAEPVGVAAAVPALVRASARSRRRRA